MEILSTVTELLTNQVVGTIVLFFVAFAIRFAAERYFLSRTDVETEQRRRILSNLRNSLFFIVLIGLMLIWAPALRTFALSLTAFAVAIILATKELILCISGSVLKTASRSMRIGHWIEINGMRGEVVDQTLWSTTIQELGNGTGHYDFTGRTIIIPNSLFLNAPLFNERFFKRYVIHSFQLVVDPHTEIEIVEEAMLSSLREEMKDHAEAAKRYSALVAKQTGVDIFDIEPHCKLSATNEGKIKMVVTALLPTRSALSIEQKALRAGLATYREITTPHPALMPV